MTDDEQKQAAVTVIRDAYVAAGEPNGPRCHSEDCLRLAARRVFWPVLPDEEFPLYCDPCAAWARRVLETLGHRYRDEALPARPGAEPIRALRIGP